ncbi:Thermonuclease precursor [Symmachiella macrocystis]|uniref:Thermonuclease n=1 Tax=Symmachiella macrocystis TaxID=2527985 RepID=A0A5C6BQ12_9PLAN|nr:thermonuclease family protein [Symmachiella macrocystis]TWU14158.1 Thermonuclease precursor [Symmachiella macrocystis]
MPRRFSRRRPTPPLLAVVIIILLVVGRWLTRPPEAPPLPPAASGEFVVKRAVDGDTLLLANGNRVRLIGVDTPETKHPDLPVQPFGPEASEYTRNRVQGKRVRLEFDKEREDDYGRILAYVYINDELLNEELIRGGYGRAITHFPFSAAKKRLFRQAEQDAKREHRGIWSLQLPDRNPQSKRPASQNGSTRFRN